MNILKRIFILPVLVLILSACNSTDKSKIMEGDYFGAWYQTMYKFKFEKNGNFKFTSDGHFGYVNWDGTYIRKDDSLFLTMNDTSINTWGVLNYFYLIDNDTCIVDYETRYDYCKSNEGWHGSKKRAFKYPQIQTEDSTIISNVEFMLQGALNSPQISFFFKDTLTNLVLEEFFKLDEDYKHGLTKFNLPVLIKSKEDIKSNKIANYVRVDDINYNSKNCTIYLNVIPSSPGYKISANYNFINNEWEREKSFLPLIPK